MAEIVNHIDLDAIAKVVAFCKAAGITRFEQAGLVLEFGAQPVSPPASPEQAEIDATNFEKDQPTPEELLLWSVGGDATDEQVLALAEKLGVNLNSRVVDPKAA